MPMTTGGDDFRGVGWSFPVRAGADGAIELARLDESIRQSILLIVSTARGERVMRPTFGCAIHELVFAPNDAMTAARAGFAVREALIDWEPRIQVLDVRAEPDAAEGDRLLVSLRYRVRATNNVFNLVYPFYLEKGEA
jgi:phage baseplate assembly protein W